MISFVLAFLLGDIYVQTFACLPSLALTYSLLGFASIIYFIAHQRIPYLHLPLGFTLGFLFTVLTAQAILSWHLPTAWEGKPLIVTGYVAALPVSDERRTHFFFALKTLQAGSIRSTQQTTLRLSAANGELPLHVGDEWQLRVRLKTLRGSQSPGAFDFEAWGLQKGLRANGYVVASADNQLLSTHRFRYPIQHLREHLQAKILQYTPHTATSPWLQALIIGERNGIAQEDWQVLRNTGTNHLMAIAGLHIGLMAGFVHGIVVRLWRCFPWLLLRYTAMEAGCLAALVVGVFYGALAGYSIPTERAVIMLVLFSLILLLRRKINVWTVWSLALWVVLLLNPLSVLTDSFWLSFTTIALIIYGMRGRLAPCGWWWQWGRVQWVIGLGLLPITLVLFQEASVVSFLANSIAIPWLGFFILPFCFLSALFLLIYPPIAGLLLNLADKSLAQLWKVLTWFASLHFASWQQAIPHPMLFLSTIIAILLLLLPAGFKGRWLGFIWLLPLLCYQPLRPEVGNVWLSVLDVGQGLAVVVQTKSHVLVYDAGPKYNANSDMGERIVLPYLRTLQIKKIDALVVSHGDNDHLGGANALLKALPVLVVKSSTPEKIATAMTHYCLAGDQWQWDGVNFSFIYPPAGALHLGNNSSCVLRIDTGSERILLTGDIEKLAEKNLLRDAAKLLPSTLLVAPHHGSKTSGMAAFIQAVHPKFVLYSTGYRNRYHFPHPSITAAYEKINAVQLNTAETGTLEWKLEKGKRPSSMQWYRQYHQRYWMPLTSSSLLSHAAINR